VFFFLKKKKRNLENSPCTKRQRIRAFWVYIIFI
jgi:hypothetical protein